MSDTEQMLNVANMWVKSFRGIIKTALRTKVRDIKKGDRGGKKKASLLIKACSNYTFYFFFFLANVCKFTHFVNRLQL